METVWNVYVGPGMGYGTVLGCADLFFASEVFLF